MSSKKIFRHRLSSFLVRLFPFSLLTKLGSACMFCHFHCNPVGPTWQESRSYSLEAFKYHSAMAGKAQEKRIKTRELWPGPRKNPKSRSGRSARSFFNFLISDGLYFLENREAKGKLLGGNEGGDVGFWMVFIFNYWKAVFIIEVQTPVVLEVCGR